MKKIAVLIPVFNNIEFTKKCISRLNRLTSRTRFHNCEIIIVVIDDGSTDGTSNWLMEHHPDVTLLTGDGSLWWSGGINMGARYSISDLSADFLLLWNNDILPAEDYFSKLDIIISTINNHTIAGSKIFYHNQVQNNIIWSFGGTFNPRSGAKNMVGYNLPDSKEFANPIEVDWLPGMGTLVPVDVVREIGFWDDDIFPQYHGDSDFTFRAKIAGFKVVAYPQLILWNDKSVSGITHGGTIKGLIMTMTDRRSNSNFRDNYRFYKRHKTSIFAYQNLFRYYLKFFGGFFKWKVLGLFRVEKKKLIP